MMNRKARLVIDFIVAGGMILFGGISAWTTQEVFNPMTLIFYGAALGFVTRGFIAYQGD